MKIVIALAVGVTAAALGWGLFEGQLDRVPAPSPTSQTMEPARQAPAAIQDLSRPVGQEELRQQLVRLTTENAELKESMAALSIRLADLERPVPATSDYSGEDWSDESDGGGIGALEPADEVDEEIRLANLEDALAGEAIDQIWAGDMERTIEEALLESEDSFGDLIFAECRKTFCRSEIRLDSFEARIDAMEIIPALLDFTDAVTVLPVDNSTDLYVYIARDGYALPYD